VVGRRLPVDVDDVAGQQARPRHGADGGVGLAGADVVRRQDGTGLKLLDLKGSSQFAAQVVVPPGGRPRRSPRTARGPKTSVGLARVGFAEPGPSVAITASPGRRGKSGVWAPAERVGNRAATRPPAGAPVPLRPPGPNRPPGSLTEYRLVCWRALSGSLKPQAANLLIANLFDRQKSEGVALTSPGEVSIQGPSPRASPGLGHQGDGKIHGSECISRGEIAGDASPVKKPGNRFRSGSQAGEICRLQGVAAGDAPRLPATRPARPAVVSSGTLVARRAGHYAQCGKNAVTGCLPAALD